MIERLHPYTRQIYLCIGGEEFAEHLKKTLRRSSDLNEALRSRYANKQALQRI